MRCPACASDSADDATVCATCGAALAPVCRRCGTTLRPSARFCDACGEPVTTGAPVATPAPRAYTPRHLAEKILTSRSAIQGERKQVTVLFADVKGSMDLAEQVDPEQLHAVLDRFFGILADGVHRWEGTVNQYTGDGIMALFGAPIAHEDHARRACHAALHLADALHEYADELRRTRGLSFAVRMGLNSGEVVVGAIGDDLRMDYTAQGHTVGLAARLEQVAEPGKVYVTEHTAALVEGYFRLRDLGAFALKGVRQPVRIFELEDVGTLRTRLDVSRARGFSRFVGRDVEMGVLEDALADAAGGRGRLVGVVAEPGVGKSRLCWEFVERCAARGLAVHRAQAMPYGRAVPYLLALELVRSWFGVTPDDGERAARKKIAGTLALVTDDLADALPLVWDFLGVADPERPAPRLEPDARLRRLVAVFQRVLRSQSRTEPAVMLLEDLHWVDGGSETLLTGLVGAVADSRTLVLANFRPEYRAAWMDGPAYRALPLAPLGPDATTALLADLVGDDASTAPLAARIAAHTGGNPFFVEELVRALVESGTLAGQRGAYTLAGAGDVTIPPSVQAVLAARIDRLAEREKLVLHDAAVIGRVVRAAVLTRVAGLPPDDLDGALDALTASAFLYPDGDGYTFAHPLTHEVAYRTQLAERRARVHAAVARAIVALDADRLNERAAVLAHHFEQAGEALEAARWSKRAAEWVGTNDFPEALQHWDRVRALVATLPETDETLALRVGALGGILTCKARMGVDPAEHAALFAELDDVTRRIADPAVQITALAAPAAMRVVMGDPEGGIGPLLEAARLAEHADLGTRLAVQAMLLLAYFVAGRFRDALPVAEHVIDAAGGDVQLGAQTFGISPYLVSLSFRGAILRITGALDEAERALRSSLELAHAHGQLEVAGYSHQGLAFVDWVRGDVDGLMAHGRAALELAERIDSTFSRTQAYEVIGAAHLFAERWQEGRDAYEQALAIMRERQTGFNDEAFYLAGLARAHVGLGDLARARACAEQAVDVARHRRTRFGACEAWLALGEVLIAHDDPAAWTDAGSALAQALAGVTAIGAASSEPFVHLALAALAGRRGDAAGARRELDVAAQQFEACGAPVRAAAARRPLPTAG